MTINYKAVIVIIVIFIGFGAKSQELSNATKSHPNIIYILADDLGYGDLSYCGQEKFSTPNIDMLAKEGMLFTQHYAGAPVCAPSRSALMTGLHTGHTFIRGNLEVKPEGQYPIPKDAFTIAELLKKNNYQTAAFGKWGLGNPDSEGDPLKQGFDSFYGYNCQKLAHNYYPDHLWDNETKVMLSGNEESNTNQYAPDLIHKKALQFIEKNQKKTFFLYYASVLPHAELIAPPAYIEKFLGKFNPEKAFKGTDEGVKFRKGDYESQPYPRAAFAAMMTLLDDQVGEIVALIKKLGLEKNTLIIFTSDNGPHKEGGADPDFFNSNGNFKGYKRDLYEGGIRVPMIVKWKGQVKEATQTDHISAFWDVMPTIAAVLHSKINPDIDGISFLPTLINNKFQKQHSHLYWEFHELNGRQAIRKENWKLIKYNVNKNGRYELYNLSNDISESSDLSSIMPEKVNELSKILESSRTESTIFKFK